MGVKTVKYVLFGLSVILLIILISGCLQPNNSKLSNAESNLIPLKIFGEVNVVGTVTTIKDQIISIKIDEIKNDTFLESKIKLIEEGENIIIHVTGVGEKKDWNSKLLSINAQFSSKIRCLDGRINSKEPFTKEKCFWEINEEDIKLI